ncbi:galactose oxidase [Gigaspora margarita]|uniref:Galactose oxidase n=1 Tax=Gigaspora margarita TaxID=4874 RepID=A0A8H3XJE5_GIGMA|nr:galactose oxidase [Gigaspora margarita]
MLYFGYIFFFKHYFTSAAFIPAGRKLHCSVLINKKIYIGGGRIGGGNRDDSSTTNEFFYLDISKQFTIINNASLPWNDLTYTGSPQKYLSTACIGGKNNDIIFILGGGPIDQQFINVNKFETSKQQWFNVNTTATTPVDRYSLSCAKFNNGKIVIFSGFTNLTDAPNDLLIFNTLTELWSLSNASNAPPNRSAYCAIILPDENILYIGGTGSDSSTVLPMDQLPLYNTGSDTWITKNTSGPTPPGRSQFSAVITPDGRIVIFGGNDDLTLSGHTATLVDNYMFVFFGLFSNDNLSSRIFMLDVSQKDSYSWVTEFIPSNATTTIPNNTTTITPSNTATTVSGNTATTVSSNKNIGEIVGSVFGVVGGLALIILIIVAFKKLHMAHWVNRQNVNQDREVPQ